MILLLGGTIDSREISKEFKKYKIEFITSTVSEYGKSLAEEHSDIVVREVMDKNRLVSFINENQINIIIDATHPFAQNVSENAINAAEETGILYLRFERPDFETVPQNIIYVKDINEASIKALEIGKNILLTTGSRGLSSFKNLIKEKNVFVRILPEISSITACEEAGIQTGNIIAMQGPFSEDFNDIIIKEKKIDLLITKDSGKAGGLLEKITAAKKNNITLIIIKRPEIRYPSVFREINKLIEKIMEVNI